MGAATTGIVGASPVARRKRKLDPDKVADVAAVLSSCRVRQLVISLHCWLLLYPTGLVVTGALVVVPTPSDAQSGGCIL